MEHNKTSVGENEPSTGKDGHESVKDVEEDKICTIDEGSKAEIEVPLQDWVEAVDNTPNKDCNRQMEEKNEKAVEKKKEEKVTSILHDSDTDDKKNTRRMESYVSFVNSNWKETLTKFRKKKQIPSNDKKHINQVIKEATGISKYCGTPEGLLHSMWLQSLSKGEVAIEKENVMPRRKSQSPYLIFCKEKEKELGHLTWKEFGVITRKEWKEIGDKQREEFKQKCKELRDQEREKYQGKVNGTTKKKTSRIKLDNVFKKELKKPRSAFSIYMDSLTSEVSEKKDSLTSEVSEKKDSLTSEVSENKGGGDVKEDGGDVKEDGGDGKEDARHVKEGGGDVKEADGDVKEDGGDVKEDIKKQANNQWRRLSKKEKDIFKAKAQEEWRNAQQITDVKRVATKGEGDSVVGAIGLTLPNSGLSGESIPSCELHSEGDNNS